MRRAKLAVLGLVIVSLSSCSLFKSGKKSGEDGAGEGNIPLADASGPLQDVHFEFDSSALDAGAQSALRSNGQWLLDNPGNSVIVEGHCDERGTAEYNMALGERRARSAADYLKTAGVPAKSISTVSYGEELPLDPGHTEDAWAKNRRDHFALQK